MPWLHAQFLIMKVFPSNSVNTSTARTVPYHERLPIQLCECLDCTHSSLPWTSSHPTLWMPRLHAQFLTMNVFPSNSVNASTARTVPYHERLPIQLCECLDCTHSSLPWTSSHPTLWMPRLHAQFLTMNVFPSNSVNASTARTVPYHERLPIQLCECLDCTHSSLPWTSSHPTLWMPRLHAQFLTMNVFPSNSVNASTARTVPYHERLPIQLCECLDCTHSSLPWTSSHPTLWMPRLHAQFLTMNVFPSNSVNASTARTVPYHERLPIQLCECLDCTHSSLSWKSSHPTPWTPRLHAQFLTMNVFPSNSVNTSTARTVPYHERLPIQLCEHLDCTHSSLPWTSSHPTLWTPRLHAQFLTMNVFPSNSVNTSTARTVPYHERLPIQLCEHLDCTHSSLPWTSSHPTLWTPRLHAQFLTMNVFPSNSVNTSTARTVPYHERLPIQLCTNPERLPIQLREHLDCTHSSLPHETSSHPTPWTPRLHAQFLTMNVFPSNSVNSSLPWTSSHPTLWTPRLHAQFLTMNVFPSNSVNTLTARTVPYHERLPIQLCEHLDCTHSSLPWTSSHPTLHAQWTPRLHAQFLTMNVFPSNSVNASTARTVPYHERLPIQLREHLDCTHSSLPWTSSHPTPWTPRLHAQFLTMNVFPSNSVNTSTARTVPYHERLPIQLREHLDCTHSSLPWTSSHPTPWTPRLHAQFLTMNVFPSNSRECLRLHAQFLTMNVFPSNSVNALTARTVPYHERLPIQLREHLDCTHSSLPWTSSHPTPWMPWLRALASCRRRAQSPCIAWWWSPQVGQSPPVDLHKYVEHVGDV